MIQLLTPDYGKFDIRACPIWAIPQLAELKRRLSWSGKRSAVFLMFTVMLPEDGYQSGKFVIEIEEEGAYTGYLSSKDMNEYRHPSINFFC